MANQVTISSADSNASENPYVISNIHAGIGTVTSNTGGIQQTNPDIILNDENGLQQPIIYSAEQYRSYMAIASSQLQHRQGSRMSSRDRYTSLHHGHTYESIGNQLPGVENKKNQSGLSKCANITIVVTLIIILVVALATLAISMFTMWYLVTELKDIKESLEKLESRNCTTETILEPGQVPSTQVINTIVKQIIDTLYNRMHYYII